MELKSGLAGAEWTNVVRARTSTMRSLRAIDVDRAVELVTVTIQTQTPRTSNFDEAVPDLKVAILRGVPADTAIEITEQNGRWRR